MGLFDQLDGRADLFAVSAMMHALITGHEINQAGTEMESLVVAATRPVPSVSLIAPRVPSAIADIIDKTLQWAGGCATRTRARCMRQSSLPRVRPV